MFPSIITESRDYIKYEQMFICIYKLEPKASVCISENDRMGMHVLSGLSNSHI